MVKNWLGRVSDFRALGAVMLWEVSPANKPAQSHFIEPRPLAYATRVASAGGAASTSWSAVDTKPSRLSAGKAMQHRLSRFQSRFKLNMSYCVTVDLAAWHSSRMHAAILTSGEGRFRRDVQSQMKSRC